MPKKTVKSQGASLRSGCGHSWVSELRAQIQSSATGTQTSPAPIYKITEKDRVRSADNRVAHSVIGATPSERLAWIVRLIAEDPAAWHSAERAARGDCLIALTTPPNLVAPLPGPLMAADVDALHRDLREKLIAIVTEPGEAMFPSEGVDRGVIRATAIGVKPAIYGRVYRHRDVRTRIFAAVSDLVVDAGERLIACPRCRAPFLAVHKQRYCTTACGQRARNDKRPPRKRG